MSKMFKVSFRMITMCKYPEPSIQIPEKDNINGISEDAFSKEGREMIKNVFIPKNIKIIKEKAFFNFSRLSDIEFGEDGKVIIEDRAFEECRELRYVHNMDSIISFGRSAFKNCKQLEFININPNIKKLGKECFKGCKNIKSINVSANITEIPEKAFYDVYSSEEIVIGDSIRNIGKKAFFGCTSVTELAIPDGVEVLHDSAFECCYNLASLTLGSGIKKLNKNCFANCRVLETVKFESDAQNGNRKIKISNGAFGGCYELRKVILPDCQVLISPGAFSDCHLGRDSKLAIIVSNEQQKADISKQLAELAKQGVIDIVVNEAPAEPDEN